MKFIIDMIHHNPGEEEFNSSFSSSKKLKAYGFNGKVFKHINCAILFNTFDNELFPVDSCERQWIEELSDQIREQNAEAKKNGLKIFYHIDLFLLPTNLINKYKNEICDESSGKISIEKQKTLEIHKILFDELFEKFPEVDGLIIRVGETYIFDTPYHRGNNPIRSSAYEEKSSDIQLEKEKYSKLIRFLKEEICEKHKKYLIFRTWDCFPDKLHANPQYYLDVTEKIEPNDKLIFSIKHTALDFWRRVKFNECLGVGTHQQIVEIQCQREYEGKGAYPNYVMDGIINGFEENVSPKGLKDLISHPLFKGIYTWSRGGGWYGPYIKNELWCDVNAYVIAQYANNTKRKEKELLEEYAIKKIGLNENQMEQFRKLCILSSQAILKGRYCQAYDQQFDEAIMPTCNWMRDDRLGGESQLEPIFKYLYKNKCLDHAINEKKKAVESWTQVVEIAKKLHQESNNENTQFILSSSRYGQQLFAIISCAWEILAKSYIGERTGVHEKEEIIKALDQYDDLWKQYQEQHLSDGFSTLYCGNYMSFPGEKMIDGLKAAIDKCRKENICK